LSTKEALQRLTEGRMAGKSLDLFVRQRRWIEPAFGESGKWPRECGCKPCQCLQGCTLLTRYVTRRKTVGHGFRASPASRRRHGVAHCRTRGGRRVRGRHKSGNPTEPE